MAERPGDILIRLQRISDGLEQGVSPSLIRNELQDLLTMETVSSFGFGSHVRQMLTLLKNPACGWDEIREEIRIVEEYLQTDEYGFRPHPPSWYSF